MAKSQRPPGCEGCTEPATIHLTQIVNGVMHKVDLCAKCPNAKNIDDPTGFSLADQLLGLGASDQISSKGEEVVCPQCGFTQPDFKKSGRLGCPKCYETFAEGLGVLLKNMHRGTQHKGKKPKNFEEKQHIKEELASLQNDLRKAVINENFETAATLRDKIRALETQLST